jgi:hypothetical protein
MKGDNFEGGSRRDLFEELHQYFLGDTEEKKPIKVAARSKA